jgi:hypothetical protein
MVYHVHHAHCELSRWAELGVTYIQYTDTVYCTSVIALLFYYILYTVLPVVLPSGEQSLTIGALISFEFEIASS